MADSEASSTLYTIIVGVAYSLAIHAKHGIYISTNYNMINSKIGDLQGTCTVVVIIILYTRI